MTPPAPKWWVRRTGNTYTAERDDARPGRGTRLARVAATREEALVSAERAAWKHARQASGGRKGQHTVRRVGDAFAVERVG